MPLFLTALLLRLVRHVPSRDQRGQTTAEYALVIVVAAVVASLVLAWAARTHTIARLFDVTIGRVVDLVGG